ncbi:MAG: NAD(P)(+) transhydrogenase (Re/Si-specific) subunit beta [Planctomycetes bacterium]|nr:NAD(P)(+) transhydrogenase (Re/Si-specific) subunit beta [Planctomycetota bacterium]
MTDLFNFAATLLGQTTAPASASAWALLSPELHGFLVKMAYLLSAVLFVFGIKMLSSPRSARRGNLVASLGMLLAIVVTLIDVEAWGVLIAGLVVGGSVGLIAAKKVPMTGMPELVALFNGSGGAASALVALAEYMRRDPALLRTDTAVSISVSVLIGMVTLTGSLVAFGKLRGMTIGGVRLGSSLTFKGQHALNAILILAVVGLGYVIAANSGAWWALILLTLIATVMGVLLTIPIGGSDMPVVVSLLNSYSGLAACATGFVLDNTGLIISGSLVGASGLILTRIMCKAMNRSLINVLLGGFGQDITTAGSTAAAEGQTIRQMDAEEAVMLLEVASKVVIIPGYGMAAAQAQHTVAEMADLLGQRGVDVKYGIHPVAGRMPGHMNVLLAEANVPYEQLADLELDSEMDQTDVVMVIGANDVVNPEADMPIFHVYKSKTVMVFKRSLNPGYAGIQNPLFFNENTVMLFGDAKKMINQIVSQLKEL